MKKWEELRKKTSGPQKKGKESKMFTTPQQNVLTIVVGGVVVLVLKL